MSLTDGKIQTDGRRRTAVWVFLFLVPPVLASTAVAAAETPPWPTGDGSEISVLYSMGLALLGGLILNLMPCVLPVLSLKALSLGKLAAAHPAAARRDGIAYSLGAILSFSVVGGLVVGARAILGDIGWGFQLQQPMLVLALALLMIAVGFNLLGVFETGTMLQGAAGRFTGHDRPLSSFLTGILAVVLAAPCTAPFMASALGAALVLPTLPAIGIFATLGLGLALPYLLLGFIPAARALLPKPGAWMDVFRQVLAFPMFATAIWLLWILGGQTGPDGMALGLVSVLLLGVAIWLGTKAGRLWRASAVLAFLLACACFAPLSQFESAAAPAAKTADAAETDREIPYTSATLDGLLAKDKPVFVYFTADWCAICKMNERVALSRPETKAFFADRGIAVVMGDWTRANPEITRILTAYKRAGVPMYLYFPRGSSRNDGILLPQILTPAIIREAIDGAPGPV